MRKMATAMRRGLAVAILTAGPFTALATPGDPGPEGSSGQSPDGFRFSAPNGSVQLRLGYLLASADSEIYDFITDQLTVERGDFNAPVFAFDVGWNLSERIELVGGVEYSRASKRSEYRDYVDQDDIPIVQDTRLTQVPLTLSGRFYVTPRGRSVGQFAWVPSTAAFYVGGGIGATWYRLEQVGEFVDFRDLVIFEDFFISDGWSFSTHALAGIDIKLGRSIGLVLEGRYQFASHDLTGSFVGFDPIDLNGLRLMAGVSFKF
jgi:opacity protein-like surface antigen